MSEAKVLYYALEEGNLTPTPKRVEIPSQEIATLKKGLEALAKLGKKTIKKTPLKPLEYQIVSASYGQEGQDGTIEIRSDRFACCVNFPGPTDQNLGLIIEFGKEGVSATGLNEYSLAKEKISIAFQKLSQLLTTQNSEIEITRRQYTDSIAPNSTSYLPATMVEPYLLEKPLV